MKLEVAWEPKKSWTFLGIGEVNPSDPAEVHLRKIMTFSFSGDPEDRSLYMMPGYERDYSVRIAEQQIACKGKSSFHLSLHGRGAVKLTWNGGWKWIQPELEKDLQTQPRELAMFQINAIDQFPSILREKINRPGKSKQQGIGLMGIPGFPIMVSTYCALTEQNWTAPIQGAAFLPTYWVVRMRGTAHEFHILVWQDFAIKKGDVDIQVRIPGRA